MFIAAAISENANWLEILNGFGVIIIPIIAVWLDRHINKKEREKEQRNMLERTLSLFLYQLSDELKATTCAFQRIAESGKINRNGDDPEKIKNFIKAVKDTTGKFSVRMGIYALWKAYETTFNDYIGFEFEDSDKRKKLLYAIRSLVQTISGFSKLQKATIVDKKEAKKILEFKCSVPGRSISPREALKYEIGKTRKNIAVLLDTDSEILPVYLGQFKEWAKESAGWE